MNAALVPANLLQPQTATRSWMGTAIQVERTETGFTCTFSRTTKRADAPSASFGVALSNEALSSAGVDTRSAEAVAAGIVRKVGRHSIIGCTGILSSAAVNAVAELGGSFTRLENMRIKGTAAGLDLKLAAGCVTSNVRAGRRTVNDVANHEATLHVAKKAASPEALVRLATYRMARRPAAAAVPATAAVAPAAPEVAEVVAPIPSAAATTSAPSIQEPSLRERLLGVVAGLGEMLSGARKTIGNALAPAFSVFRRHPVAAGLTAAGTVAAAAATFELRDAVNATPRQGSSEALVVSRDGSTNVVKFMNSSAGVEGTNYFKPDFDLSAPRVTQHGAGVTSTNMVVGFVPTVGDTNARSSVVFAEFTPGGIPPVIYLDGLSGGFATPTSLASIGGTAAFDAGSSAAPAAGTGTGGGSGAAAGSTAGGGSGATGSSSPTGTGTATPTPAPTGNPSGFSAGNWSLNGFQLGGVAFDTSAQLAPVVAGTLDFEKEHIFGQGSRFGLGLAGSHAFTGLSTKETCTWTDAVCVGNDPTIFNYDSVVESRRSDFFGNMAFGAQLTYEVTPHTEVYAMGGGLMRVDYEGMHIEPGIGGGVRFNYLDQDGKGFYADLQGMYGLEDYVYFGGIARYDWGKWGVGALGNVTLTHNFEDPNWLAMVFVDRQIVKGVNIGLVGGYGEIGGAMPMAAHYKPVLPDNYFLHNQVDTRYGVDRAGWFGAVALTAEWNMLNPANWFGGK